MSEKQTVIGFDGLIEFGKYLDELHDTDYEFKMENADDNMVDCSLDDVIRRFQIFCSSKADRFRVGISYLDDRAGAMVYTDKMFTRRKQ